MKRLVITYGDAALFDGDVDEFTWQESSSGVVVSGKLKARPQASASGLMDMISQASRKKTESVVEQKKTELEESK